MSGSGPLAKDLLIPLVWSAASNIRNLFRFQISHRSYQISKLTLRLLLVIGAPGSFYTAEV